MNFPKRILLALLSALSVPAFAQPPVGGLPISSLPAIVTVQPGTLVPVVDVSASPYVTKVAQVSQLAQGLGTTTVAPNTLMLRDSSGNSAINVLTAASVTGLNNPVNPTDAATKSYVDASGLGLNIHAPAAAATTGTSYTLSGGTPSTLDGVALSVGFRIVVKDQSDQTTNGIYTVQTVGSGTNGTWVRASDANSGTNLITGSYIFTTGGTINGNAAYVMVTPGPITIGTSLIVWQLFTQTTQILASNIIGQIIGSQLANATLTYTQFASSIQPVGIVSTLPNPSGYTGVAVVFNTTDGNLYRYVSGAWTTAVPPVFTSLITGTQIGANTIATGNIATNAIQAGQIAANAVTAGTIAANAVTTGSIAAGAVTATQVAAGAITTNAIAAGTILASNIAALTITGAQIQAGTLTADKFNVNSISAISANIGTITSGSLTASASVTIGSGYNAVSITSGGGLTIGGGLLEFTGANYGNPQMSAHGFGTYPNSVLEIRAGSSGGAIPPGLTYIGNDGSPQVVISEGGIFMHDQKFIQGDTASGINLDGANSAAGLVVIASTQGSAGALLGYFHFNLYGIGEVSIPYYHD